METTRIQNGKTERIEAYFVNSSGVGVTASIPTLKIRRMSDSYYWNGTAFQSAVTTINMTEVSASGDAGKYFYSFNTAGLSDDNYYITATLSAAANSPQFGELKVGGYVNYLDMALSTVRLSVPMFNAPASGDSAWTKEEKDAIIKKVGSILELTTKIEASENTAELVEAQNLIKEKIGETAGELIAVILKEVGAIVEKQSEGILELKRFLHTHSETSLQANEAVKSEMVAKIEAQAGLIEKITPSNLLGEILEKISLVEKISIRQTPTETLEEIHNENADK